MAYIFDAAKGETPQSIARQRELAMAILSGGNVSPPASPGAGIGNAFASIARGLASRATSGQADASEAAGAESANKAYRDAIAASLSTGQPMTMPSAPTAPQSAAPAGGAPQARGFNGTQEQFVSMLLPAAIEASKETGIDPRIIVAQAAQETGWGKSAPGNNYFGIKSHGMPGGNVLATSEHVNGQKVPERASFRAYASPEESVKGYSSFIQTNPRYKPLMQAQSLDAQLAALQASGYATDPNYAASVGSIARKIPVSGTDQPQMPENAQATQMPPSAPPAAQPSAQPSNPAPADNARLKAIADALSNPFLNQGQRSVLTAEYQREMQARDPMYQMQMEKGRLELNAIRNPQAKATDDMREYDLARQQGYAGTFTQYQMDIRRAGAPSTNVNVGEGDKFYENLDKKNADTFAALSDGGMGARGRLANLNTLDQLLQQSPTGAGAQVKLWLGDLGINTEGVDDLQATRALIEKLVPEQRAPGSGPMSDADIAMYRKSLPSVMNQPGGNAMILGTAKAIAQYDIQMGAIADAVADREITPAEGRKRIRELANPLDGYRERMREFGGAPPASNNDGWTTLPGGVRVREKGK